MISAAPRKLSEIRLRDPIPRLAQRIQEEGGLLLLVGGWVRDALLGEVSRDIDLEVYGLTIEEVTALVGPIGFTPPVGRQFPVWRHTGAGIDLGLPRGEEADADTVSGGSGLEDRIREAARHRDLTINAISWDPLEARLFDPMGGEDDLASRVLRAADLDTFGEDPLRVLRVARLSARFDAHVDPSLVELCRGLLLDRLPVERLAVELRRMLLELDRPSRALETLHLLGQLGVFPPLAALRGVAQDARWHPEGDVYRHTCLVVDQAAQLAAGLGGEPGEHLLFAALCHDLGKPMTTTRDGERIRSIGHEREGARISREWLASLRYGKELVERVGVLVEYHLAPAQLVAQGAGPRAYRRLARKLDAAGVTMVDLERVARVDHLGRTTPEARAGEFEAGAAFLEAAAQAEVDSGVAPDIVRASYAMRRGVAAGPRLGRLLARCREVQDDTGWTEEERIFDRAVGELEGET